jgi:hypothetical protein
MGSGELTNPMFPLTKEEHNDTVIVSCTVEIPTALQMLHYYEWAHSPQHLFILVISGTCTHKISIAKRPRSRPGVVGRMTYLVFQKPKCTLYLFHLPARMSFFTNKNGHIATCPVYLSGLRKVTLGNFGGRSLRTIKQKTLKFKNIL